MCTFGQFHLTHPIVPAEDNRIELTDDLKGAYLADVVGSLADIQTLTDLITLIQGPVITVSAPAKSLPWDEPWSLNLLFRNPSQYPIPLLTFAIPDVPPNGTIIFIDEHGFDVGSAMGPLQLAGDGPTQSTVPIPAEGTLAGSITVTKPMISMTGDPRTIRRMYVMYQALKQLDTLSAGWDQQIFTAVDVTFVTTASKQTDSLARSSSQVLARLDWWQTEQHQTEAEMALGIDVSPHRFVPNNTYGSTVEEPKPDERTLLINALQLERDGIVVRPAQYGPTLSALLTRLATEHRRLAAKVSRAELATLVPPGRYTLRLVLAHGDEQALSNTLTVTIP